MSLIINEYLSKSNQNCVQRSLPILSTVGRIPCNFYARQHAIAMQNACWLVAMIGVSVCYTLVY